jgi:TetR/AcrR family transcriptional repressor of nem operon
LKNCWSILKHTAVEADDTHPLLKAKAVDAFALWKNSVVRLINKGIERKEIRAGVKAEPFAAILMALVEGAVMQAKVTGKSTDLHSSMDFLEKIIRDMKK